MVASKKKAEEILHKKVEDVDRLSLELEVNRYQTILLLPDSGVALVGQLAIGHSKRVHKSYGEGIKKTMVSVEGSIEPG